MAGFTENIKIVVETVTGNAARDLNSFSKNVADAEGATGKLKAGIAGAGDFIKNNLGLSLAAAGTAAVAFGKKAVDAFQSTALAAGKLADATGLTVESASRFLEVAADMGIESGALTTSFGRLAKTVATTPQALDDIGASIVRLADGTVDVEATFLSTVEALQRIPDASDRAAAASQIFGRGWQQIGELVNTPVAELRDNLASVSSAKVINEKELANARKFRETMDNLNDIVEDATQTLGQLVVEGLGPTATAVSEIVGNINRLTASVGGLGGTIAGVLDLAPIVGGLDNFSIALDGSRDNVDRAKAALTGFVPALEAVPFLKVESDAERAAAATKKLADEARNVEQGFDPAGRAAAGFVDQLDPMETLALQSAAAQQELADETAAAATALDNQRKAVESLNAARQEALDADLSAINSERALQQTLVKSAAVIGDSTASLDEKQDALYEVAEANLRNVEAQAKANSVTLTATDRAAAYASGLVAAAGDNRTLQAEVSRTIAKLNEIPANKRTEIQAAIDRGDIATAQSLLNSLSGSARIRVYVDQSDIAIARQKIREVGGGLVRAAQGGVQRFANGGVALVGERGPELVGLPDGSNVQPAERIRSWLYDAVAAAVRASGPSVNVTMGGGLSPERAGQRVTQELRKYRRLNGQIISGGSL